MQIFVNLVERLNDPFFAPPCTCALQFDQREMFLCCVNEIIL